MCVQIPFDAKAAQTGRQTDKQTHRQTDRSKRSALSWAMYIIGFEHCKWWCKELQELQRDQNKPGHGRHHSTKHLGLNSTQHSVKNQEQYQSFLAMVVMYWSDWGLGQRNRFYRLEVFYVFVVGRRRWRRRVVGSVVFGLLCWVVDFFVVVVLFDKRCPLF